MWDDSLDRARRFAGEWMASLPERPVGIPVDAAAMRARLDGPLPPEGLPATQVLDELAAALEPGLVATGGPRYFGFVTGGALPAALGADWMVSATDQNVAAAVMSPAAAAVEAVTTRWVLDLLGLPPDAAIGFVTGAQMANVSCLAAARHALLDAQGWDVGADGLAGAPVPTVLVGGKVHSTVLQALRLLGFGSDRAVRVPADDQGRMRPDLLRELLAAVDGPVLVCAQAGQVDTGACDPLEADRRRRARPRAGLAARRRRVRAVGRGRAVAPAPRRRRRDEPTPGPSTPTSGSTSPTTRGWRSSATRRR